MFIKTTFFSILLIQLLSFSTFCNGQEETPGIKISDPAPNEDDLTKILLYYDMEGISGQNDIKSLTYGNEAYQPVRELLTNDVNAVIDGLFAGGADSVDVVDAHGSLNPEPDILLDKMDSRAKMVYKNTSFRPYFDLIEEGKYDAVVVVCMHSKTGGGGFAAHTYTFGMDWILNNMSINETEIIAYAWGQVGVPVIFASGDDKLKEQLQYMPWIEYVTVKYAKGASDAELRPLDEVHSEMKVKAKKAVENISNKKVVNFTTPIIAQLKVAYPASLTKLEGVPGINYEDNTVTFEAANYQEAYDGITALMGVARTGYTQLLYESIRKSDDADEIFKNFWNLLDERWMEVESGRWETPSPKEPSKDRKYFGAR